MNTEMNDQDKALQARLNMNRAGYTQCAFVAAQTLLFPSLGVAGSAVAGVCGVMPWASKHLKTEPSKVFGMVMASLVLSPLFGNLLFCTV